MFKNKKRNWFYFGGISLIIITIISVVMIPIMSISAQPNYLSISLNQIQLNYPANWYDNSQLTNGLWYSDINAPIIIDGKEVSFMKIYSLGGTTRVMELSTYPRAYKDTSPHVYTVNTPFVVTEDDYNEYYNSETANVGVYEVRNDIEDGTFCYINMYGGMEVRLAGETATHFVGEPLPGSFPLWVESETLSTPKWVDNKESVFPMVFQAIKGELVNVTLYEGVYRQSTDINWTLIPASLFNTYKTVFTSATSEIRVNKITKNKDRTILRIVYDRIID